MTRLMGFAGWSGSGKTTLLAGLIPRLTSRGLSVSTIKHAHHAFDIDRPGKDSYRHRQAGATEVLIASTQRWALMHELRGQAEPSLTQLLAHLAPVDLILVEGFKRDPHPKIEVHRSNNGKPWLFPEDDAICAILSDVPGLTTSLPHAALDDLDAACELVLEHARPLATVLDRLRSAPARLDKPAPIAD